MQVRGLYAAFSAALMLAGVLAAADGPPKFPSRIVYVPHATLDNAVLHGNVAGGGTNELVPRDNDLGVRVSLGKKNATPPVSAAEVHSTFGHVFLIEDGGGTLVLGGELVDAKENRPGEWTGSGIKGGQEFQMTKGDMITVEVGMPHWWKQVSAGGVAYLAFHSFPEHNQPASRPSAPRK
jgi:mannose-6-phosphate isomerase-like protein (cupin superfamily)